MPLPIRITPTPHAGPCSECGRLGATLCLYVECADSCGETTPVCPHCLQGLTVALDAILDEPPEDKRKPISKQYRKTIRKHERDVATRVSGSVQKASGALSSAKGDVRKKGILRGEVKETGKGSYTLKRAVLDKIRSECTGTEKPFVYLRFVHPVTKTTEDEWVCIPFEDWEHAST